MACPVVCHGRAGLAGCAVAPRGLCAGGVIATCGVYRDRVTDSPFRVIVVEDDEDVALYVQTILRRRLACDVKVLASADGYETLEDEFDPEVVVTDLELPGRGGFELLADIRARRSDLPVAVMTAYAGAEYAERARRQGADDYLAKPLSSKDLVAAVERLARRRRGEMPVEGS